MLAKKKVRQEIYFRRPEKLRLARSDHKPDVFPSIGSSRDMESESRWRLTLFDVHSPLPTDVVHISTWSAWHDILYGRSEYPI